MPLRDLLKKKDKLADDANAPPSPPRAPAPEFTFIRTDTHNEEVIEPPAYVGELEKEEGRENHRKSLSPFRMPSNASSRSRASSASAPEDNDGAGEGFSGRRQMSQRLRLRSRSRTSSHSSMVPSDLPTITDDFDAPSEEKEAKWEERATFLAQKSPLPKSPADEGPPQVYLRHLERPGMTRNRSASDVKSDETIQEAIRLHEGGELERSTQMFGRLAERGNVLSQVLYGLALRHGWGCIPNAEKAITYLSAAASNSAEIEAEALKSGMRKGGAAKGELVLAMFELANCFRHGWGVQKDAVAARQYYETAANLGDTDAMNEVAWCYLEGFGGKKDKFKAAQFLRNAERAGAKTLGNTW